MSHAWSWPLRCFFNLAIREFFFSLSNWALFYSRFPFSTLWIVRNTTSLSKKRWIQLLTTADLHISQKRPERFSRLLHFERLLQHFLMNAFACCELNDLNWVRKNQQQLRADLYNDVMNRLNEEADLNDIDSKITVLPFSHVDSPRYMKTKKQNAFALIRIFDKPTFFITFICNSEWKELKRNLPFEIVSANRPDFVARIFQLKLRELMKNLTERHVLNEMKTHTYVIEFQKRNLPHVHILIIVASKNDVNSNNADDAMKTVIPDPAVNKELYDLIIKNMIHKNCLRNANAVCHDEKNNCIKFFPKPLSEITDLNHRSSYSLYERHVMSSIESTPWNNTWVIPYNPWLLRKYKAHINVEICTFAKSVTYLYKYIYKKSDSVDVSTTIINQSSSHRNDVDASVDEMKIFHDARWIDFCETVWRILNLSIEKIKPSVTRLTIHLKNQQRVVLRSNQQNASQLQKSEKLRRIILTKYFEMNLTAKKTEKTDENPRIDYKDVSKDPRDYLYQNFSTHFVWSKKNKSWSIRKKDTCVDRMYFMNLKADEIFYLRVLLCNRKRIISFENIRTVDVQIEDAENEVMKPRLMINKETCVTLKLTDNDSEWHEAITETIEFETVAMLRDLLLTILLKCESFESRKLWKKHKIA